MQVQFADSNTPQGHYSVCCSVILPQEGITPNVCICCGELLCGRTDCPINNRCVCEDIMREMNETIEEM